MSIFNKIQLRKPKKSPHNLSYVNQLSLDFGKLVPVMCKKVYPGDKFVHSHEFFLRTAPFVNQVFQNFQVRTDYFFVPSRLLWQNFEAFLSRGINGSTDYQHPYIDLSRLYDGETVFINTLVDFLNLPTDENGNPIDGSGANLPHIDALPFFAYVKIMLDYYFDENLYPEQFIQFVDRWINNNVFFAEDGDQTNNLISCLKAFHEVQGDSYESSDLFGIFSPMKRSYPKDYFTSALPFAQRGPIVQIPLNGAGDVEVSVNAGGQRIHYEGVGAYFQTSDPSGDEVDVKLFPYGNITVASNDFTVGATIVDESSIGQRKTTWPVGGNGRSTDEVVSDIKNAPALQFKAVNVNGTATITDLRTAMTVQSWLEKNARAGVRYKEQLASHFGVKSKDYRLDRAELLGHYKNVIQIGQTFTTAADLADTFIPGMGVSNASSAGVSQKWKRKFDEHGYVIGIMSVFPTAAYFQGLPKVWTELDVFDYFWPEFQHIGEQEIKRYELYVDSEDGLANNEVFGYTPRYAHYKTSLNEVHGDFRKSLNFMHDARKFSTLPKLNNKFVTIDIDYNDLYRVFNAKAGELSENAPIYIDLFHHLWSKRPMDYFGNPRIF